MSALQQAFVPGLHVSPDAQLPGQFKLCPHPSLRAPHCPGKSEHCFGVQHALVIGLHVSPDLQLPGQLTVPPQPSLSEPHLPALPGAPQPTGVQQVRETVHV